MPPVSAKAHINEHGNVIADILSKALPAHVIPPKLRSSYENVPACDAEILNVYCEFEAAGFCSPFISSSTPTEAVTAFSSSRSLSPPQGE